MTSNSWHQINVGEAGANDWCFDLPEGHTIEIGPDGEGSYDITYVVRRDGVVHAEINFPPQPDRAAAMTAVEAIPLCATCGLPIASTDERLTGWDHIEWDDLDHEVTPAIAPEVR